jgi:hypothetical protein
MRVAAIVAAALVLMSCGARDRSPAVAERRLEGEGLPPVTVRVVLQREHQSQSARYLDAAAESLRVLGLWSLVDDARELTLVDPPWSSRGRAAPAADGAAIVLDRTPWWTTPTAMTPELAVARALSRRALTTTFDTSALPPGFVHGFAEYLARQIVTGLFTRENNSPGFAFYEARHFGGFVPRFIRIRVLPESDEPPLTSYRRHPAVDVTAPQVDEESLAAKTVLTLGALDRWVSRPVLDAIIVELVRQSRGGRPTVSDFGRVAAAVSGQDLSWLFVQTFGGASVFDYGVAELTSRRAAGGSFETTVTVARYGDGLFTGATAPRVGRFESGRGMTLLVSFAGGEESRESWDGRDERKTFEYRSASRAVSAAIDPDRQVTLDLKRTNNGRTLQARAGVASRRWAARWAAWLEHLLLTYASLV